MNANAYEFSHYKDFIALQPMPETRNFHIPEKLPTPPVMSREPLHESYFTSKFDEEARYREKVKKALPLIEKHLLQCFTKFPQQNTPFHKEGFYSKNKNDITLHIYSGSEMGVFRQELDLAVKLLNEIIKSPLCDKYFHILHLD